MIAAHGSAWMESTESPGYLEKTIQHGNCTITILRPVLDDGEREKREQQVVREVERGLRDYLLRKVGT